MCKLCLYKGCSPGLYLSKIMHVANRRLFSSQITAISIRETSGRYFKLLYENWICIYFDRDSKSILHIQLKYQFHTPWHLKLIIALSKYPLQSLICLMMKLLLKWSIPMIFVFYKKTEIFWEYIKNIVFRGSLCNIYCVIKNFNLNKQPKTNILKYSGQ